MNRVLRVLNTVTDREIIAIDPNVPLKQIEGWDSMRAVNFQIELEQEFGVDLSGGEITSDSTLNDVAALLRAQHAEI